MNDPPEIGTQNFFFGAGRSPSIESGRGQEAQPTFQDVNASIPSACVTSAVQYPSFSTMVTPQTVVYPPFVNTPVPSPHMTMTPRQATDPRQGLAQPWGSSSLTTALSGQVQSPAGLVAHEVPISPSPMGAPIVRSTVPFRPSLVDSSWSRPSPAVRQSVNVAPAPTRPRGIFVYPAKVGSLDLPPLPNSKPALSPYESVFPNMPAAATMPSYPAYTHSSAAPRTDLIQHAASPYAGGGASGASYVYNHPVAQSASIDQPAQSWPSALNLDHLNATPQNPEVSTTSTLFATPLATDPRTGRATQDDIDLFIDVDAFLNGQPPLPSAETKERSNKNTPRPPKVKSAAKKESAKKGPPKRNYDVQCSNCGTKDTPVWRKSAEHLFLCNACGLYRRLHGRQRPFELVATRDRKRNSKLVRSLSKTSEETYFIIGSSSPSSETLLSESQQVSANEPECYSVPFESSFANGRRFSLDERVRADDSPLIGPQQLVGTREESVETPHPDEMPTSDRMHRAQSIL